MTGDIALTVALAFHGNALLLGRDISGFSEANSAVEYCKQIRFNVMPKLGKSETANQFSANNPEEWFAWIKSEHVQGMALRSRRSNPNGGRTAPAYQKNGSQLFLNIIKPEGHEYWLPYWEYSPGLIEIGRNKGKKPWKVTYQEWEIQTYMSPPSLDLYESYTALEQALQAIYNFSQSRDMGYTSHFLSILDALKEENDKKLDKRYWPTDLAPEGMLKSRPMLLLKASQSAWVFTGMGSWVDNIPEPGDESLFVEVTEGLFLAVMNAICAVVNSTCPAIAAPGGNPLR